MNKDDVIKLLNELKEYNNVKFTMNGEIIKIVHLQELNNYPDSEFMESQYDNFATPYSAIEKIEVID